MKKNYKKETLAKNIINSAKNLRELNYLHKDMGEIYDKMKLDIEVREKQMKYWDELYSEFSSDKKLFIKKYAKPKDSYSAKLVKQFLEMPDPFE